MGRFTIELANFAVKLSFNQLPRNVVNRTKMCIVDAVGIMVGASTTKIGKKIANFTKDMGGVEEATVICSGFKTSCANAAFVNGSFSEILENQDGVRYGGYHPGSAVIPAALAVGEKEEVSGTDLITAIIIGYEISSRIAAVTHPEQTLRGFVPLGTIGPFGAAAAVGKILNFDHKCMVNALGIAGFLAPITRIESFFKTSKPLHGGQAAKVGVIAALAAKEGLTGSEDIVETYCETMKESPEFSRLTEGLGEKFEVMETYIKPYTACRHTHGAIEATLNLVKSQRIKPDDIQKVKVWTYGVALRITGSRYTNTSSTFVEAQFSIPYMISAAILDGNIGIDQLSEDRLMDTRIHELAKKVEVIEDPAFTKLYPDKTSTRVEIFTKYGKLFVQTVDLPKGDPRKPLTSGEITDKFRRMATNAMEYSRVTKVMEILLKLEKLANVKELMDELS